MTHNDTPTCTVVTAVGGRCGAPAVTTFVGRNGETFAECVDHAVVVPAAAPAAPATAAHPPTRTRRPYVLVAHGEIVGYADAVTPAVEKRAARLGAKIVAVVR